MNDEFVSIKRVHDAVHAQMARDLLEQADIPVLLPGVEHRGMLGAAGAYLAIPIQVRRQDAAKALELLAALEDPDAEIVDEEAEALTAPLPPTGEETGGPDGPYRSGGPREEPKPAHKLKRIATFLVCALGFGTAHMYAGDYRRGTLLALGELGSWLLATAGGVFFVPLFRLVDLFGSLRRISLLNEERAPSRRDVWLRLAPLVVAFAFSLFLGARTFALLDPASAGVDIAEDACDELAACGEREFDRCVNQTDASLEAHRLSLTQLEECHACLAVHQGCEAEATCRPACAAVGL